MTPLQAMKQALEALESASNGIEWYVDMHYGNECDNEELAKITTAVTDLRTAIEEMEKAEPVAWLYTYAGKPHAAGLKPRESWADHEQHPLYTHPAPIPEGWHPTCAENYLLRLVELTRDEAKLGLATPDNTAELDALIKDAMRYRWMRDVADFPAICAPDGDEDDWDWVPMRNKEQINAAIDAAMQSDTPPKE